MAVLLRNDSCASKLSTVSNDTDIKSNGEIPFWLWFMMWPLVILFFSISVLGQSAVRLTSEAQNELMAEFRTRYWELAADIPEVLNNASQPHTLASIGDQLDEYQQAFVQV